MHHCVDVIRLLIMHLHKFQAIFSLQIQGIVQNVISVHRLGSKQLHVSVDAPVTCTYGARCVDRTLSFCFYRKYSAHVDNSYKLVYHPW